MMQFYKKRDFGELIGDTLAFLKRYGKNYFKNYLLINGLLLVMMLVLVTVGYREFFMLLFGGNLGGESFYFESYFQENMGVLITVTVLCFFLFCAVALINYAYPIFYMKRLSETGNANIKVSDILSDLKQHSERILKLFLGLMFVVTPLAVVLVGISYALVLILIGILVLFLVIPALINAINFLMFDYFHTSKGFFASLSYALRAQFSYPDGNHKSPFWKYWGSVVVLYMIINIVSSIFTIIPMVIGFSGVYLYESDAETSSEPVMFTILLVCYAFALLFSFLMSNLIYINAGLMYYDNRTDLHRKENLQEIETIGNAL